MIFGTGIDIIEVDRINNSIQKYSDRFKKKILENAEIFGKIAGTRARFSRSAEKNPTALIETRFLVDIEILRRSTRRGRKLAPL